MMTYRLHMKPSGVLRYSFLRVILSWINEKSVEKLFAVRCKRRQQTLSGFVQKVSVLI